MEFDLEELRQNTMKTAEQYINIIKSYIPKDKELEWWIQFRDPADILKNHATYLYCEVVFYIIGFLTFIHSISNGGRFKWLWLATIAHAVTVECVSYYMPDVDNFWHAQSMVMLVGQRLPLHIIFVYPVFIYTACIAVSHMKLRWWADPFAVGLTVVLLDIPFDIMGVKLLWWTWHDDDPNIFDRHYWVPWTSYYFHAAFASSFTLLFFGQRSLLCGSGLKYQSTGFFCEVPMLIVTGLFSFGFGVLQFIPIYHPLHDDLKIDTKVCVLLLLVTYALIMWSADRFPYEAARISNVSIFNPIFIGVLIHYIFYIYLVFTSDPLSIRSIGYHQPVGPCGPKVKVLTPTGNVLKKSKYLCLKNFDEGYFDLNCVKQKLGNRTEWYTVCGTQYENHAEYIIVICAFCVIGLFWFWQLLLRSGSLPRTKPLKHKQQ